MKTKNTGLSASSKTEEDGKLGKVSSDLEQANKKVAIQERVLARGESKYQERALVAPPFYAIQLDIAYGFSAVPWKKARNKVTLYALVVVCVLTSATSILSLEGISTEDIVAALEMS